MKTAILALLILIGASATQATAQNKKTKKESVTFITDLHCQDCVNKITKNIAFEKGVTDIRCDLKSDKVTIDYRADRTDKQKLADAMKKIGYTTTIDSTAVEKK
ncbi:MAG: heavy-metal-associated domain-containing protein [Bacteroidales bacterium]